MFEHTFVVPSSSVFSSPDFELKKKWLPSVVMPCERSYAPRNMMFCFETSGWRLSAEIASMPSVSKENTAVTRERMRDMSAITRLILFVGFLIISMAYDLSIYFKHILSEKARPGQEKGKINLAFFYINITGFS